MDKPRTSFVFTAAPEQIRELELLLRDRGWEFSPLAYAHWKAAGPGVNVAAFCSGKVTVQGGGAAEFVEFTMEPQILKTVSASADPVAPPALDETPHGGVDESGKGDFFGPLVIAGVITDARSARVLVEAGVRDSKAIKSAARIHALASAIRRAVDGRWSVVAIGPERYNQMYEKIGNLNRLLAWGHARIIENLLDKAPDCPRMLSDQFADESLIRRALLTNGRKIQLDQRPRAESDIAVAAASILARERFLDAMERLGAEHGVALPRGVSGTVRETAARIAAQGGPEALARCAKRHFRTFGEVTGLPPANDAPTLN